MLNWYLNLFIDVMVISLLVFSYCIWRVVFNIDSFINNFVMLIINMEKKFLFEIFLIYLKLIEFLKVFSGICMYEL